jgi:hypothetical protein
MTKSTDILIEELAQYLTDIGVLPVGNYEIEVSY